MKRFFYFAVALFAVALFTSCGNDDEDDPTPPTPFEYKAPCLNWHCTINEVRTYMKSIEGFIEDIDVEKKSDGTVVYKFSKGYKDYSYTFKNNGLEESSYDEIFGNANFDKMKSAVTKTHGVLEWKEEPVMMGVTWWTTTLKGKKTSISIGKGDSPVEHMYVIFKYDEFDF